MNHLKVAANLVLGAILITGCQQRDKQTQPQTPPQTERPAKDETVAEPTKGASSREANARAVARDLEQKLPEVTALDTFGGQLIAGYLNDKIPGEQVVAETFSDSSAVLGTMAEMSLALHQLKDNDRYDVKKQEKVLVLEGAMTQFLSERIREDERLATAIEYGTATGLGVIGGIYSEQIIKALKSLGRGLSSAGHSVGQSAVVQVPAQGLQSLYQTLKGSPQAISNWLSRRTSTTGPVDSTSATVSRSTQLYRQAVGYFGTRGALEGEELVARNIYRVLNSPDLARGFQVHRLGADRVPSLAERVFQRTGSPGFNISQLPGEDQLIVRMVGRGGQFEYYQVRGRAVRTITKSGEELAIPESGMLTLIQSRLQDWGNSTLNFITSTGEKIKTGLTGSKPYQTVAASPRLQQIARGTAVGAPIGVMTLLALRPIDPHYITLDQYVRELKEEGIGLEDFTANQKKRADIETGRR